ncbi:hypothetical protein [Amycolatopsis sp. YIM 10]|uniref:hypothetical protein n=1 Tax=Amycolatopsis sp. YIM 10 TaxID=2653857 RepID=UPI00129011AE|nr:hypothetical protein [Amycolatopsis sp. YIM 10]
MLDQADEFGACQFFHRFALVPVLLSSSTRRVSGSAAYVESGKHLWWPYSASRYVPALL